MIVRKDPSAQDRRPEVSLEDGPPPKPEQAAEADRYPGPHAEIASPGDVVSLVRPLGRVGAPRGAEATSDEFSMWVPDDQIVEKTQLVRAETEMASTAVRIYGLASEASRRSRRVDILEESDRYDNDPGDTVPISPGGVTYARV